LRGGKDVFDEVGRKMGKERNLMTGQKKVEKNLKIEDGISNYLDFFFLLSFSIFQPCSFLFDKKLNSDSIICF
jgi:hypothetical protein